MTQDLDYLLMKVRDYRSQIYAAEAVRCYRVGAHRAAITSIWTAVVFDLISKYRELAVAGDKEAQRYTKDWDSSIHNNNTTKLLELERHIIEHACQNFSIIDRHSQTIFQRLREDRHLCAHPAYADVDTLFEPSSDVTRAHISSAIELLLSQAPIQGRYLFEAFGIDLISSGFPKDEQKITEYVDEKYLRRMRPNIIRNFGIVLLKSAIYGEPINWILWNDEVLMCLSAIKNRSPGVWQEIETEMIRIINLDAPSNRVECLIIICQFPDLFTKITPSTQVALRGLCGSSSEAQQRPTIFKALSLPGLSEALIENFRTMDEKLAQRMIILYPHELLWPACLQRFSAAKSWRSAESGFDMWVAPFGHYLTIEKLSDVFLACASNYEIYSASGTPRRLLLFMQTMKTVIPSDDAIRNLYIHVSQFSIYEALWGYLESLGWRRPSEDQ